MPVDSTHAQYEAAAPQWAKCRAAIAGQDAVHASGETYLPKLSGQDNKQYLAYRDRASFYNATGRTLDGMTGMIFRKPPVVEVPAGFQTYLDDVDLSGMPMLSFAECVVDQLIAVGRVGVLVDYPPVTEAPATVGEAESIGLRPFASIYPAESIIYWRVGKYSQLLEVRLKECVEVQVDEWTTKEQIQYRVLDLAEGNCRVRIFECVGGKDIQIGGDMFPKMRGAPLDFIPFAVCNTNGLGFDVQKPPLLDLVNVNFSHYRLSADYRHGLHFTGLPTAVVTGHLLAENESLSIGSSQAWVFSEPDARANYLEFQGAGLGQIKEAMAGDEEKMASLGARMLAAEKRDAEAAETAAIHRSGENSVLASIAASASQLMVKVFGWMATWGGISGEIKITLNTDYMPVGMTPQELTALVQSWQSGAISKQTLFNNLQRGEIIAAEAVYEDEEELIESLPPLGALEGNL